MVSGSMNRVVRALRRAAMHGQANSLSDRQLLERFLATHEEAAFEALVRRHGPMVLGVCRRVLEHAQDAEDAYQATFLILVRKATSILLRETLASWLYGVAYRTAQKARVAAARRRVKEKQMARPEAIDDAPWQDLRPLIDRELNSLPEKYREPLLLCDLQGASRKAAALRLGWSEGTLSGRLSRARDLLARRLASHGVTLTGAAVAVALSSNAASACVPAALVLSTVQAATSVAAGTKVAGAVSASVATLTEGVLKAMFTSKMKTASAILLGLGFLGAGAGIYLTPAAAAPAAQETRIGPPPQKAGNGAVPAPEQPNLPLGPPPVQALAKVNADGTLTVKAAVPTMKTGGQIFGKGAGGGMPPMNVVPPGIMPPGMPPPGMMPPKGAAGGFIIGQAGVMASVRTETYDLKSVQVFDTKGQPVDPKVLSKLLKEETVAMATWGQLSDPLHLRVLKEGTLILVLPPMQGQGFGGGVIGPGGPATAPPPAGGAAPIPVIPAGGTQPPGKSTTGGGAGN
jgi:RNA polymerase sigma factor (sigma-70 family)